MKRAMNGVFHELSRGILRIFCEAEFEPDVRVIVLTDARKVFFAKSLTKQEMAKINNHINSNGTRSIDFLSAKERAKELSTALVREWEPV